MFCLQSYFDSAVRNVSVGRWMSFLDCHRSINDFKCRTSRYKNIPCEKIGVFVNSTADDNRRLLTFRKSIALLTLYWTMWRVFFFFICPSPGVWNFIVFDKPEIIILEYHARGNRWTIIIDDIAGGYYRKSLPLIFALKSRSKIRTKKKHTQETTKDEKHYRDKRSDYVEKVIELFVSID